MTSMMVFQTAFEAAQTLRRSISGLVKGLVRVFCGTVALHIDSAAGMHADIGTKPARIT